jgi:serine/threonine-protein kinase
MTRAVLPIAPRVRGRDLDHDIELAHIVAALLHAFRRTNRLHPSTSRQRRGATNIEGSEPYIVSSNRNRAPRASELIIAAASQMPRVAGYRVERMLGEGGFGQVWRATRESDDLPVAIKLLHLELVRSSDAQVRFEREFAAIARLDHRNIVRAIEHGVLDDARPYLVLDYIDGPSLREVIQQRRTLPPHEMLAIIEPLCEALATAHAHNLVHRDIKASNVVMSRDALGPRPVLLDFGLVKLIDDDTGPVLTSSRNMLGTPTAMAPEQMKGLPVDARTDVYALGALAYHMLTGAPAFGGTSIVQSYMLTHGQRPRPSMHVDIDPAIDAPVVRALATAPVERFDSAIAFARALRAVIAPATPARDDVEVVALYVEGGPGELALAAGVASAHGMTVAVSAPDSVLAVAPRPSCDTGSIARKLGEVAATARIALGLSRARMCGNIVDGDALAVEGWAPHPLPVGMWVADGL